MRTILACSLLLALNAAPAVAQTAVTAPVSFGGDLGIFAPFENGSSGSFTGRFTADVYSWDRLGTRFTAGFANPRLGDKPFDGRADMVFVTGGLIQRLAASAYHAYAHTGIGLYHLSGDRSGTDLGIDFGAGFEVPLGMAHVFLTPELTAYVISGIGPRFSLALTVGLHTRPR